jgi:hypothetical protein
LRWIPAFAGMSEKLMLLPAFLRAARDGKSPVNATRRI